MARTGWGRHTVVATGSNDNTKQISVNAWNNDLDTDGIIGFTPETVASASSVTPTNSFVKLSGATSVDTIALANSSDGDLLYVITTGSVTLNNTSSPSSDGDIRLLANANKDLSTTVPTILMGNGAYWYEYGGGITNALNDIGDVNITSVGNEDVLAYDSASSKWINQTADESGRVTASSTNTFTNKTIDADGTGNSITNIENADIKASAAIDATKIADGSVTSAEFQYINSLSSNAQTQINGKQATLTFGIANTNAVKIDDADAADDDYAKFTSSGVEGRSATEVKTDLSLNNVENTALSTWAGTSNVTTLGTITTGTWTGTAVAETKGGTNQTTYTAGDILYASASNTLSKLAKGTASQQIRMNSGATAPEWFTPTGGSDTPWTVVHNFADYYYDMEVQTKPADPAADHGRFYVKEIDSNNDGVFCIIRKNGGFQETQIV